MIMKTEIIFKNNNENRVIIYNENDDSSSFIASEPVLYELYEKLREHYKRIGNE